MVVCVQAVLAGKALCKQWMKKGRGRRRRRRRRKTTTRRREKKQRKGKRSLYQMTPRMTWPTRLMMEMKRRMRGGEGGRKRSKSLKLAMREKVIPR
jgi:hypothetical protein